MPPPRTSQTQLQSSPGHSRPIVLTEIEAMGGAERSVLALCRWLQEHSLPHHVLTYADHIGLAGYATTPLQVVQLRPAMHARAKVAALRRYFKALPAGAPPALMSGYQPALHATLAGVRGFHCLMHDTPSLFEDAGSLTPQRRLTRRLSDAITGFGLRSGGATLVTSEYLRSECRRAFQVQAHIARMGGLSGAHAFRPRKVHGKLHLLSVSRLEANKRLDWLLRALALLDQEPEQLSKRVDWTLHVVGRGSEAENLADLSASLGLGSRVRFHGFLSDEALEELYGNSHLFLMPAVQGYGIPAIEALTRGIPVLLHRDSGVSDILLDTPWATVFTGAEASLAPALQTAIRQVLAGTQVHQSLPSIPTEDQWAEQVAQLCGWL